MIWQVMHGILLSIIERPSSPGTPVVVPREGDTFEQLSYINKPSDAVILRWKASANDGGTPIIGTHQNLIGLFLSLNF